MFLFLLLLKKVGILIHVKMGKEKSKRKLKLRKKWYNHLNVLLKLSRIFICIYYIRKYFAIPSRDNVLFNVAHLMNITHNITYLYYEWHRNISYYYLHLNTYFTSDRKYFEFNSLILESKKTENLQIVSTLNF